MFVRYQGEAFRYVHTILLVCYPEKKPKRHIETKHACDGSQVQGTDKNGILEYTVSEILEMQSVIETITRINVMFHGSHPCCNSKLIEHPSLV